VYDKMANALDSMADEVVSPAEDEDQAPGAAKTDAAVLHIPAVTSLLAVSARAHTFLADISQEEMDFSSSLTMGERTVEVPGRYAPLEAPSRPEPIRLPELRTPAEYATNPANTSVHYSSSPVMSAKLMQNGLKAMQLKGPLCSRENDNVELTLPKSQWQKWRL